MDSIKNLNPFQEKSFVEKINKSIASVKKANPFREKSIAEKMNDSIDSINPLEKKSIIDNTKDSLLGYFESVKSIGNKMDQYKPIIPNVPIISNVPIDLNIQEGSSWISWIIRIFLLLIILFM